MFEVWDYGSVVFTIFNMDMPIYFDSTEFEGQETLRRVKERERERGSASKTDRRRTDRSSTRTSKHQENVVIVDNRERDELFVQPANQF